MKYDRASGIILHPTSLPGPDGVGDLGPEAFRWIDFLEKSGCMFWQVLPLGPTGYGDSPYQAFSAFAGNPYLISPTILLDENLLTHQDLVDRPQFPSDHVDYGSVIKWKLVLLDRAFERFKVSKDKTLLQEFDKFLEKNKSWLDDFALFMSIKDSQGGVSWNNWPKELRLRKKEVIDTFRNQNLELIQLHFFRQFIFFRQWQKLRDYAHQNDVRIIGDAPIFVAYDSADVWAHPELFSLDENGLPTVVAGVPPDYFSKTGQLWGNPLYKWDIHKETGYSWWIERLSAILNMVDVVRLDHFRGFAGYWEIPFGMPTAEVGHWVPGPGTDLFSAVQSTLGDLKIIAEDLGIVTPDVNALRNEFYLPGMKILQFAFGTDPDDVYLPHNYPVNCVAYTGTHDNNTALGWFTNAPERERDYCRRYLASSGEDIVWDMLRVIWRSSAIMTLAPIQDFLSLDSPARMNYPGIPSGNWTWRMNSNLLSEILSNRIHEINYLYSRLPPGKKQIFTGANPYK
jgi:4-alpha-glucanotransferase